MVTADEGWYGNGALWVSLPPDAVLPSLRSADGVLVTKFPWWRSRPGRLQVESELVGSDHEPVPGSVPDGYGDVGFNPSELSFTGPGCWRVTGVVDGVELSFVVWVCETDDFEIDRTELEACGVV